MVNWIYSHPTWLWGTGLVVAVTLLSCLALVAIHRAVDVELRRKHNDVVAASMAIVGVAYAVLLAFVAVATWENYTSADKIVDVEASLIGDVYRETIGLPEAKAAPIKAAVKIYLEQVMAEEWPSQRLGHVSQVGRPTLVRLQTRIAALDPQTPGETAIFAELLRTSNGLYDARRTRILAAESAIPEIVWWIAAFGTALTIAFTFLFGTHDFRVHLAVTGLVAASMCLVIILIVALDRPFRGDLSVSVEAYENVRGSLVAVDARDKKAESTP